MLPPDSLFTLNNPSVGQINALCFHHDERLFAATQKGQVFIFDLQTNRSTYNMHVGNNPLISIYHTEDCLLTLEKGGRLKLNHLSNCGYKLVNEVYLAHSGFCRFDCNTKDNVLIAPKNDNSISVMSIETLKEKHKLDINSEDRTGVISSLKYLNILGQSYVLAGYDSGVLKLWDLRTNDILASEQFNETITSIDYDLVTNRGIIGSTSDKIEMFTINTKSATIDKKAEIPIKNSGVNCVRIRKDLKVFVTGGFDGRIRVFSWKSLRPLAVLSEHKTNLMDIAFSDGIVSFWKSNIMAAGGSDGKITLWDIYN